MFSPATPEFLSVPRSFPCLFLLAFNACARLQCFSFYRLCDFDSHPRSLSTSFFISPTPPTMQTQIQPLSQSHTQPKITPADLPTHPLFQVNVEHLSTDERVSLSYQRARLVLQTHSTYLFMLVPTTHITSYNLTHTLSIILTIYVV